MSPTHRQLDVESCYPPQECATPARASRVTRASVVDMLQSYLGADVQLYASQVNEDDASVTLRSSLVTLMPVTVIPSRRQLLLFVLVFVCLTSPVTQLHRKVSAGAHGHGGHAVPIHQDGDENVLTLWIALDDVDETNGGLRVLRGGHKYGRLPFQPVKTHAELSDAEYFSRYNVFRADVSKLLPSHAPLVSTRATQRYRKCFTARVHVLQERRDVLLPAKGRRSSHASSTSTALL